MKLKFSLVLIFFCFYFSCIASDVDFYIPKDISSFEGVPTGIVNGHVNTATGEFLDFERDLGTSSIEPLHLQRTYTSQNHSQIRFCRSWYLNHIQLGKFIRKDNKEIEGSILENSGAFLKYSGRIDETKGGELQQNAIPGLTNFGSGEISAQNNLKNNQLSLDLRNSESHLKTGSGTIKKYSNFKENKYVFTRLESEIKKNLHQIKYEYSPNGLLSKIIACGKSSTVPYSLIHVKRSRDFEKDPHMILESDNGSKVKYVFGNFLSKEDKKRLKEREDTFKIPSISTNYYLTEVTRTDAPSPVKYSYTLTDGLMNFPNLLLAKKTLPDNRYLLAEYYVSGKNPTIYNTLNLAGDDFRVNYVKQLKEPAGDNGNPIITYSFFYAQTKNRNGDIVSTSTEVHDALKHKTSYEYDQERRLVQIGNYTYPEMKIYRRQRFYWLGNGNIQMVTMDSEAGTILSVRAFDYDAKGNVLCERFYGNITNRRQSSPTIINGKVITNGCDCYEKHFQYSEDGLNLLLKEVFPNGKIITYKYLSDTNLITAKFIADRDSIKIREFNEYDEDGCLVKKVIDDGTTEDINNLRGIHERRITTFTNRKANPGYGFPEVEEETYLQNGSEILNKKTFYTYTQKGELASKTIYDADNTLLKSEIREYDAHGNITKETNSLGETITRQYDENNNLIYESGPRPDYYKKFVYDLSNRLKEESEFHSDGTTLVTKHSYDLTHKRTSTIDIFGNETKYTYDAFGRLIRSQSPFLPDAQGKLITQVESFKYDVLNNKIAYTNSYDETTYTDYNLLGKPTKVIYPDGTQELYSYNLNGLLEKHTEKNGCTTQYCYDFLDRILTKEKRSPEGNLISTSSYSYNSFHLISETDPEGYVTNYSYDGLGRKSSVSKESSLTCYEYDSLDRITCVKEWFGPQANDFTATFTVYDLLDRVIEERSEDHFGNIFTRKTYAYDIDGNQIQETFYTSKGPSTALTEFDSHKKPIAITDAEGNTTSITYNYHAINKYGQSVLEITSVDPLGNITITTMNVHGKEAQITKKNRNGQNLYVKELFYDGRGNCNLWKETVTSPKIADKMILTGFEYNSANSLISLTKAKNTQEERITYYRYNSYGQKESLLKPDGVELYYLYDSSGRIASEVSSDGTIHYTYQYDLNDNLIAVIDQLTHTTTLRAYDGVGNILSEKQASELSFTYSYDRQGRLTQIIFPDHSTIDYEYNPKYLAKIKRLTPNGQLLFLHQYTYDLAGNIEEMHFPLDLGKVIFSYNLLQNLTSLHAPHWKESLTYDAVGNLITNSTEDSRGKRDFEYEYDDLYQLVAEKSDVTHLYTYDSIHNRLSKDLIDYKVNQLNQLTHQGESSYTHDLSGNLIEEKNSQETINFIYDARDRLTKVIKGNKEISYFYDSFNRRISQIVCAPPSQPHPKTYYAYLGQKEIGALNERLEFIQHRILGNGEEGSEIGAAVALEINDKIFVPIHDHNGNVVVILDAQGSPLETYRYTAFGEEECFGNLNPWRFSSKRIDSETSFVYFGRRYYSPTIGRWITADPQGYQDGPNLYAYVHNSPLIHCDPFGLYSWGDCKQDSAYFGTKGARGSYNGLVHPLDTWTSNFDGFCRNAECVYRGDFNSLRDRWNNTSLYDKAGWCAERASEVSGTILSYQLLAPQAAVRSFVWATDYSYQAVRSFYSTMSCFGTSHFGKAAATQTGRASVTKNVQKSINLKNEIFSLDNLSKSGQIADRSGFTKAGRAAQKHGGRSDSIFQLPKGNQKQINKIGQEFLDNFLTHPNSSVVVKNHRNFVQVIDITVPKQGGARFSMDGKFIGFLEP